MLPNRILLQILLLLPMEYKGCRSSHGGYSYKGHKEDTGTLAGDVQNWAVLIQNYILQLASEGIKREYTQSLFDKAKYEYEEKYGDVLVQDVKKQLEAYFSEKKAAAMRIRDKIVEIYDNKKRHNISVANGTSLSELDSRKYLDADIPERLPKDLKTSPHYKQPVSLEHSVVKISDEVPRGIPFTINSVLWTAELEDLLKQNHHEDRYMRWQYFGSTAGVTRLYPGREWDTNFAGFYNDYDPRVRPWYIAATSGPKDVVIILDCSLSMQGEKFTIAQAVAKTVINTLTRQDYVNVICARASHWDEVGKWHYFSTDVLSCQQDRLVQATIAHRKDLIEKVYKLKPGGTSELEKGFDMVFDLLNGRTKTGCQSIVVFVTDGKDTDGEPVRCGPGYYTRSGYVPGPICKYNWTKVWDVVEKRNTRDPKARIFSYLTIEDGEAFPGKLACSHKGSLKKLMTGENLISQMDNYFSFLSGNTQTRNGLWTSPYLDAWGLGLLVTYALPCISKVDGETLGVAGVDATLDEIENLLNRHLWGTAYSFLMNIDGEVIFHPRLTPSTALVDDPIFIPIEQLEQKGGLPAEFSKIAKDMKERKTGSCIIPNARTGVGGEPVNATYYYAGLNDSDYSFAFVLTESDKVFRRAKEPTDTENYDKSYFNTIKEYNSTEAKKAFPGTEEYLQIRYNTTKYPNLRVSLLHSSIFLAPKCHCDPNAYFYDEDLAGKTVRAHRYINGYTPDLGCDTVENGYKRGIRADVLISQPVEKLWRVRKFEGIEDVKWTYVGMRSGVFRTYPAHRSNRRYDPSKRPWFKRAASTPDKTSISTPYMDAAGVGKIITISQAIFEGMTNRTVESCMEESKHGPWTSGCKCAKDEECVIGYCYVSEAEGEQKDHMRCANERVEAVTSLDILYNRFHSITMKTMEASDGVRSCGSFYDCPDGEPDCQTRCYLFDKNANLITDPDFLEADALDDSKYKGVTMGKKEGEVMKDLVYRHGFFQRKETVDFQGVCGISPYAPKVTLDGLPSNPEEKDNLYKNRGPIPQFHNDFGCIMDQVIYKAEVSKLGPSRMITGNVSGPCMSGFYYVTILPKTNLYLLVIENWKKYKDSAFYNFNCKIAQSVVNSGKYRIINGTCAHQDTSTSTLKQLGKCPLLRDIAIKCAYTTATRDYPSFLLLIFILFVTQLIRTQL